MFGWASLRSASVGPCGRASMPGRGYAIARWVSMPGRGCAIAGWVSMAGWGCATTPLGMDAQRNGPMDAAAGGPPNPNRAVPRVR
jgi:hypothetical protein